MDAFTLSVLIELRGSHGISWMCFLIQTQEPIIFFVSVFWAIHTRTDQLLTYGIISLVLLRYIALHNKTVVVVTVERGVIYDMKIEYP